MARDPDLKEAMLPTARRHSSTACHAWQSALAPAMWIYSVARILIFERPVAGSTVMFRATTLGPLRVPGNTAASVWARAELTALALTSAASPLGGSTSFGAVAIAGVRTAISIGGAAAAATPPEAASPEVPAAGPEGGVDATGTADVEEAEGAAGSTGSVVSGLLSAQPIFVCEQRQQGLVPRSLARSQKIV